MVGTKGFALFHFSAASAIMTLIGILRSATGSFSVMNAHLYDIKNILRPDHRTNAPINEIDKKAESAGK